MHRKAGASPRIYRFPYRKCRTSDFQKRGNFKIDDSFKTVIERRLCPDIEDDDDLYQVMNAYGDETERFSFATAIYRCNSSCASEGRIQALLDNIYFTFYTVTERANTQWSSDNTHTHIVSKDVFHSQFQLGLKKYIDSNNFFRLNTLQLVENVVNPWADKKQERFVDIMKSPVWQGAEYKTVATFSYDRGLTFVEEQTQQLFGAHFFLYDDRIHHERVSRTFVQMISEIGGGVAALFAVCSFIGRQINRRVIMGKFIRNLFLIKKDPSELEH